MQCRVPPASATTPQPGPSSTLIWPRLQAWQHARLRLQTMAVLNRPVSSSTKAGWMCAHAQQRACQQFTGSHTQCAKLQDTGLTFSAASCAALKRRERCWFILARGATPSVALTQGCISTAVCKICTQPGCSLSQRWRLHDAAWQERCCRFVADPTACYVPYPQAAETCRGHRGTAGYGQEWLCWCLAARCWG